MPILAEGNYQIIQRLNKQMGVVVKAKADVGLAKPLDVTLRLIDTLSGFGIKSAFITSGNNWISFDEYLTQEDIDFVKTSEFADQVALATKASTVKEPKFPEEIPESAYITPPMVEDRKEKFFPEDKTTELFLSKPLGKASTTKTPKKKTTGDE